MSIRQRLPALLAALVSVVLLAQPAEAQGLFDRLKEAAGNTVREAGEAARSTAMEEGTKQAGFLLLAEGGFAGTAAPWMVEGESVAFAEIPGNAYVSPNRLALVLCQGPDALDGIVLQGDFSNVTGSTEMLLADGAFSVFLVQGGRSTPLRSTAGRLGSLTTGTLSLEPGDAGGLKGSLVLAIGEDAVAGSRLLPDLFARSRVVELDGSFRAAPVASIEQISCGTESEQPSGAEQHAEPERRSEPAGRR